MKIKVTIEEVISQDFEIEVSNLGTSGDAYDEIRQMYKDGKLVLDQPRLIEASVGIPEDDGDIHGFVNLHVN